MNVNKQSGVSLIITFFVMIIILGVVLAVSTLLYSELKVIRNIGNSVVAFYAADSGIEKVLYYDRRVLPELAEAEVAIRGLCSMCDMENNPDACQEDPGTGIGDKSIYCNNCQVTALDSARLGCNPERCNNCEIIFETSFNNIIKTYYVTTAVSPSPTEAGFSDFEIKSKGSLNNVSRQINIMSSKPDLSK